MGHLKVNGTPKYERAGQKLIGRLKVDGTQPKLKYTQKIRSDLWSTAKMQTTKKNYLPKFRTITDLLIYYTFGGATWISSIERLSPGFQATAAW